MSPLKFKIIGRFSGCRFEDFLELDYMSRQLYKPKLNEMLLSQTNYMVEKILLYFIRKEIILVLNLNTFLNYITTVFRIQT